MDYSEKLKDPRWQKKRLQIFERDHWTCKYCGEEENTLHLHHLFYFKGKEPWEINDGFLVTLCENCHHRDEECKKSIMESFTDDIGSLLKTIWDSGYNVQDLLLIAEGIFYTKKPKTKTLLKVEIIPIWRD